MKIEWKSRVENPTTRKSKCIWKRRIFTQYSFIWKYFSKCRKTRNQFKIYYFSVSAISHYIFSFSNVHVLFVYCVLCVRHKHNIVNNMDIECCLRVLYQTKTNGISLIGQLKMKHGLYYHCIYPWIYNIHINTDNIYNDTYYLIVFTNLYIFSY